MTNSIIIGSSALFFGASYTLIYDWYKKNIEGINLAKRDIINTLNNPGFAFGLLVGGICSYAKNPFLNYISKWYS